MNALSLHQKIAKLITLLFVIVIGLLVLPAHSQEQDLWSDDEFIAWDDEALEDERGFSDVSGFLSVDAGNRLQVDGTTPTRKTLRDLRLHLETEYLLSESSFVFKGDVWIDGVREQTRAQLRELAWQGSLSSLGDWGKSWDAKLGQQILTWGTGDYVFLNDLFPKDYQSFFAGRADAYLKAPSLAAKFSGYFDTFNIDLVLMPEFEPDISITGDIFSFYSPLLEQNIAPELRVKLHNRPDDGEVAIRLHRSLGSFEVALYGYRGYTKQPLAMDDNGDPRYARLSVYGASVSAPVGRGLGNIEYAYYDSREDVTGENPMVPNTHSRTLIGYQQELSMNVTGAVQWYAEWQHDYSALVANSPFQEYEQEKVRHWLTTRVTWLGMQQRLQTNVFVFYSPTDADGYAKFSVSYSPTDTWQLAVGGNVFWGEESHTFFSQFKDATNAYASYRYYF